MVTEVSLKLGNIGYPRQRSLKSVVLIHFLICLFSTWNYQFHRHHPFSLRQTGHYIHTETAEPSRGITDEGTLTGHLLFFRAPTVFRTRLKTRGKLALTVVLAIWARPSWKQGAVQLSWGIERVCEGRHSADPSERELEKNPFRHYFNLTNVA